jgi:hypothetical protein
MPLAPPVTMATFPSSSLPIVVPSLATFLVHGNGFRL